MRKGDNPSKQHYNPVIHQRFRESKIQAVMLQATRPAKQSSFKLLSKQNARKWQVPGI